MQTIGNSYLLDLNGVWDQKFHKASFLEILLEKTITISGLTKLVVSSHQFIENQEKSNMEGGATAFAMLSESHISVHTWPEFGKIVIDLFSCGSKEKTDSAIEYLLEEIVHENSNLQIFERGVNNEN